MALDTQLEQAASGLRYTEPGISMFGSARSTASVMPEMLQLGQVMQMRAGMQQDAYQLRDMARKEQSALTEADDFNSFSDAVTQTKGMTEPEKAQHLNNFFTRNPSAAASSQVKGVMDVLSSSRSDVFQARQQESALSDLESNKSTRRDREDLARLNTTLELEKAKAGRDQWTAMLEANEFKSADDLGAFLGKAKGLDVNTQEAIITLGERFQGIGNEGLMKGLGSLVNGFGQSEYLIKSYEADLAPAKPILDRFGIKPGMDPAARVKAFEQAKREAAAVDTRTGSRHFQTLAQAEPLLMEMESSLAYDRVARERLAKELPELLALSEKQGEGRDRVKEKLRHFSIMAGKMNEDTRVHLERRSLEVKRRQDEADFEKEFETIRNTKSRTELNEGRLKEIEEGKAFSRYLENDQTSARLRVASLFAKDDKFLGLKPKEQEDKINAFMEGVLQARGFKGTNSISLKSGSNRGADLD